jgi:hypothetical protein
MQRPSAVAKVERRYLIPERLDDISAALLIAALLRAAQGFHAYTFEVALYHINACAVLAANLDEVARNGSTLRRMPHGDRLTCRTFGRTRLWLPMFVLARTMPGRRVHWRAAKPVRPAENTHHRHRPWCGRQYASFRRGFIPGLCCPRRFTKRSIASPGRRSASAIWTAGWSSDGPCGCREPIWPSAAQRHYFERILECKAALAVQRDPLLHDIAAHYLGGQAKLITTRLVELMASLS